MRTLVFLALLLSGAALAAENRVTTADRAEIRAVINQQLDAFRRDDARGAFALVSPEVQRSFGTPERFMETVRLAYRAVYRSSAVAFLEVVVMDAEIVQRLQVTDHAGAVWLAYYAMQRQKDGNWRASGCHLVQPARIISASLAPA
jgi:uncharacterized protein DUF4864